MSVTLTRRTALAVALAATATSAAAAPAMGEQALGDPAARLTMIEYASLTCSHCATFHNTVLPDLRSRYIESGQVRLVFRDFPLDELALRAAQLARCAGPERYFRFLSALFAQQEQWAAASDPLASLKQLGRLGGLPEAEMDACLADKALEESILQSRLDAQQQFGVSSTPTFVINGQVYAGSRDADAFAALIDPLLN